MILIFVQPPHRGSPVGGLYCSLHKTGSSHVCMIYSDINFQLHVFSKTAPTILLKLIYVLDRHKNRSPFFFCYVLGSPHSTFLLSYLYGTFPKVKNIYTNDSAILLYLQLWCIISNYFVKTRCSEISAL